MAQIEPIWLGGIILIGKNGEEDCELSFREYIVREGVRLYHFRLIKGKSRVFDEHYADKREFCIRILEAIDYMAKSVNSNTHHIEEYDVDKYRMKPILHGVIDLQGFLNKLTGLGDTEGLI